VRRTRVDQLAREGKSGARVLSRSLGSIDNTIAATQLGITLAGLALGALGEPALARIVEPPVTAALGSFASEAVTRVVAVVVAFTVVTFAVIVFGELAPKSIALARAERVALTLALPVQIFALIFRPVVFVMNKAGQAVVKPFGLQSKGHDDSETLDAEELDLVIQASARAGLLSNSELLIARRALEFSAIQANQIMIPRTEVVAVDATSSLEEVLALAAKTGHTRYPVYEENIDHISGILDVKALIGLVQRGSTEWRRQVRPAVAVPESVSVEVAVAAMRGRQTQMAVLVDEHGGTSGILTADEVLYRLLGRWLGGNRPGAEAVRSLSSGNLMLSGLALITDVEDATGAELSDEDYETVGGFLMARLGRMPRTHDEVQVPGFRFRILGMDGRRVDRVLVLRDTDSPPMDNVD
jgi:CBS domain containing-hemolysin-like protein